MKLTNGELLNAKAPLETLMALTFPVKVSLALARLVQKVDEYLIPAETVRGGLFQTYGTRNKEGLMEVKPDSPNLDQFKTELAELLAAEVEIDVDPVALPEATEVSPALVMILEKFIRVE